MVNCCFITKEHGGTFKLSIFCSKHQYLNSDICNRKTYWILKWCRWNLIVFCIWISLLEGFLDILQDLLIEDCQKLHIFCFQSEFWKQKINSIFLKLIFLSECLIRKTSFISSILKMNHSPENSFSSQFLKAQNQILFQENKKSF